MKSLSKRQGISLLVLDICLIGMMAFLVPQTEFYRTILPVNSPKSSKLSASHMVSQINARLHPKQQFYYSHLTSFQFDHIDEGMWAVQKGSYVYFLGNYRISNQFDDVDHSFFLHNHILHVYISCNMGRATAVDYLQFYGKVSLEKYDAVKWDFPIFTIVEP